MCKQLFDTLERLLREEPKPLETEVAVNDQVSADIIQERRDLSRFGLKIPEKYGGLQGQMESCTPLRRFGKTQDIAGTVRSLALPASAYITGQVIAADGGETIS